MYLHKHTNIAHMWGVQYEPKGRDETPEGPEESRWTKSWQICIRIFVQMHLCIHMLWGGMRSGRLLTAFFLLHIFFSINQRCDRTTQMSEQTRMGFPLRSEFANENHGEAGSSKQCNDQRTDQTACFLAPIITDFIRNTKRDDDDCFYYFQK